MPVVIPLSILYAIIFPAMPEGGTAQWMTLIVGALVFIVVQAATIFYISSVAGGDRLSRQRCYQLAIKCWVPLLVLYTVTMVVVGIGLALLIIPGLIFLARFVFAEFYCVLDGQKPLDAMNESWEQTKDYQWVILWGLLIIFVGSALPVWLLEEFSASVGTLQPVVLFVATVMDYVLTTLVTIFSYRVFVLHRDMLDKNHHDELV